MEYSKLKKGDVVYIDVYDGFTHATEQEVIGYEYRFDEHTGIRYKVLLLGSSRDDPSDCQRYDSRTGAAIDPPLGYGIVSVKSISE